MAGKDEGGEGGGGDGPDERIRTVGESLAAGVGHVWYVLVWLVWFIEKVRVWMDSNAVEEGRRSIYGEAARFYTRWGLGLAFHVNPPPVSCFAAQGSVEDDAFPKSGRG